MNLRSIGKFGEKIAANYLEEKGYFILEKNWCCYAGEIDIIALEKENLVFCEVKYVRYPDKIKAWELFTNKKKRNLLRTIDIYLDRRKKDIEPDNLNNLHKNCFSGWRLDLLCVTKIKGNMEIIHYQKVLSD